MKANKRKVVAGTIFKWISFRLLIGLVTLFYLGKYYPALDFDIVNGFSRHSGYSSTKEEAIHRKTYVCDVKLPHQPYNVSNTHIVSLRNGWIEQSWDGGFWHWTTYKDTGDDIIYHIVLDYTKSKLDTSEWTICNKHDPTLGYVQLQDFRKQFTGNLSVLPKSDTLRYTVLKRDTIDFNPHNIEGELVLVLQKKR
jgi:hypothetical protein